MRNRARFCSGLRAAERAATTPGESAPPMIMMAGTSSLALLITRFMTAPTPKVIRGMTSEGMMMVESRVRRSRSESRSSLR